MQDVLFLYNKLKASTLYVGLYFIDNVLAFHILTIFLKDPVFGIRNLSQKSDEVN